MKTKDLHPTSHELNKPMFILTAMKMVITLSMLCALLATQSKSNKILCLIIMMKITPNVKKIMLISMVM